MSAHIDGTFEVVGAARALGTFGALQEARLSHGYLFSGPAGVGKKTFARRLAQSLLCERPKTTLLGYDGTCPPCRSFLAGSHPDFYESTGRVVIGDSDATPASFDDDDDDKPGWTHARSIRDQERMESRGLVRELQMHPYVGRWRIVLLGDIDFASPDAANALLKFFEEPPSSVLIVLTTDAPHGILPTIRSRLVDVPFAPLANADVVRILELDGVAAADAQFAASAAMGSVSRARSVLEGAQAGLRDVALSWFEDVLRGRPPDTAFLDRETKPADRRKAVRDVLEFVRMVARDWAVLTVAGPAAPMLASDLRSRIEGLPRRSARDAAHVLAAVADAQRLAATNVTPNLVLDYLRMNVSPR